MRTNGCPKGCFWRVHFFSGRPIFIQCRVAQEPNRNREPEPSELFFRKPKAEPEPPEPFSRNRNRNRNRPFLFNCAETQKNPFLQRKRRNRKPEPLEPFHRRTVTEPNRGLPASAGTGKDGTLSMRVPDPSPILAKNRAPIGAEILSSTGAGVWRRAPEGFPDSSSVLDKFQSAILCSLEVFRCFKIKP